MIELEHNGERYMVDGIKRECYQKLAALLPEEVR